MSLRRLRMWLWLVIAAAAVMTASAAIVHYQTMQANDPTGQGIPQLGGAYSMTDQTGRKVTEATYAGMPQAIFFGFTHCPDVCPTTLMEMTQWLEELGPAADRLRPIFVSVDVERDTPEVLREYLSAFDRRIIGLTGTADELAGMTKAYGVYYKKVPAENGDYTMEHTASVLLFDERGRFRSTIDFHEGPEPALAKLRKLLQSAS
jgi:protein SCO1